ncbi:MAG: acylphosphatase [Chitinophagales bacterium]|nr:acylphosphatase [Chitinophagales bacterium]
MKSVKIKVFGKVQGVFYRNSCKNKAVNLGIDGFVKNKEDGTVYIEASGDKLEEFIDWCEIGPSSARVDHIEIEPLQVIHENKFEIRR